MDKATVEVTEAIPRSHKLRYDQVDDFSIRNQSDFFVVMSESTKTFTALLAASVPYHLLSAALAS